MNAGVPAPEAVEFDVETGAEVSSFPLTGVVSPEAITIKGERLCGNPLPTPLCGRMSGGGSFPISGGTNAFYGFTLSSVDNPPNRMTLCWKDSTGKTNRFATGMRLVPRGLQIVASASRAHKTGAVSEGETV